MHSDLLSPVLMQKVPQAKPQCELSAEHLTSFLELGEKKKRNEKEMKNEPRKMRQPFVRLQLLRKLLS